MIDRDAYGRPRSSRSIPTGKGSRGGTKPDYWVQYRADNPEYLARDKSRRRLARARALDARDIGVPTFTQALVEMLRADCARSSQRNVAMRLMIGQGTIHYLLNGRCEPSAEVVDAAIAHYGIYAVLASFRGQVRSAREQARRIGARG